MNTPLAFHGDMAVKAKYLARVRAHRLSDDIAKGFYWHLGKGCAVGCTLEGSEHIAYETELGIPVALAYLEDTIFEGLPHTTAREFPERFLEAVEPGADLSLVISRFMVCLLNAVKPYAEGHPDVVKAVGVVETLYRRLIDGDRPTDADWLAAAAVAEEACKQARHAAYEHTFGHNWRRYLDRSKIDHSALRAEDVARCALHAAQAVKDPSQVARAAEYGAIAANPASEREFRRPVRVEPKHCELMADILIEELRRAPAGRDSHSKAVTTS